MSYPVKTVYEHLKTFYQTLVKEARHDLPCMVPPPKKKSNGVDSNGEGEHPNGGEPPFVGPRAKRDTSNEEDSKKECVSVSKLLNDVVELHNHLNIKKETELSNLLKKSIDDAKVEARRRRASEVLGETIIPPFPDLPKGPQEPGSSTGPTGPVSPRVQLVQ